MASNGIAFSGGGIRSAAFCSGVMRRLFQQGVSIDFLSCVGGGGFVGTAYMEWKHHHDNDDSPDWHTQFFEHIRKNSGYLCNWSRLCQGHFDSLKLSALAFLTAICIPLLIRLSYAVPLAYVIDCVFGRELRPHPSNVTGPPANYTFWDPELFKLPCVFIIASIIILFMAYSVYLFSKKPLDSIGTMLSNIIYSVVKFSLAFLFAPWFINAHFITAPTWIQVLPLPLGGIAWVMSPRTRRVVGVILTVYVYAYVIYWRVFRGSVAWVPYSSPLYGYLLCMSGIVMFAAPLLEELKQHINFTYVRGRLEDAFLSVKSRESSRTVDSAKSQGLFCQRKSDYSSDWDRPLTFIDLEGVKPQFISNMIVKNWRRVENSTLNYESLTISPSEVETIDRQPGYLEFDDWLEPDDVTLSDAMTLSAASLAPTGSRDERVGALSTMGIEYWTGLRCGTHFRRRGACYNKLLPLLIQITLAAPLIACSAVYLWIGREAFAALGVFTYILLVTFLILITFMSSWAERQKDEGCDRLISWFTIHVPQVRLIRDYTNYLNVGSNPPQLIYLADGGHLENLGFLPLLKRRLRRIVVINGGLTDTDACAEDLLKALNLARSKLRCSFTGLTGRDILEDIRSNLLEKPFYGQPRCYQFKVTYFVKDEETGGDRKVGEGDILYIVPRNSSEKMSLDEYAGYSDWQDLGMCLDSRDWGPGPEISEEEAQQLTFCCCHCCHSNALSGISTCFCGDFPYHSDVNQFFTPAQFAAYHRHGYHACVVTKTAEFLEST